MMIYNVQINILSVGVVMLILQSNQQGHIHLPENKSFRRLLHHLLLLLILDSVMWICNEQTFIGARSLAVFVNHAYYAEQALLGYMWGLYSHKITEKHVHTIEKLLYPIPLMIALVLTALNPFTQNIFSINADNVYTRGWGVWGTIYAAATFIYLAEAMLHAALYAARSDHEKRKDGINLLIATSLPLAAAVMQMLFYGMNLIWGMGTLGTLMLYSNVQIRHAAKAENELQKGRTAIMLSQIQPHFLYNALSVIKRLCDVDPRKASEALEHFAHYLRNNLESITATHLIPFEKELEHVRDYLYLEQMRFEEKLTVQWQIEVTDFILPPLTVQPLVENAVRHGITKKKGGGTLTIQSVETPEAVVITVTDTGVGFDVTDPLDESRSHIGIENVQKRLLADSGGSLLIHSEKGVGTRVEILLPKGELNHEDGSC